MAAAISKSQNMKMGEKELSSFGGMVKYENTDDTQFDEIELPQEEVVNWFLPKKVGASMLKDSVDFQDRIASLKFEEDVLIAADKKTTTDKEELGFVEHVSDDLLSTEFEAVVDKKPLKYEYPDWLDERGSTVCDTIADSGEQLEGIRSQYQCTSCNRIYVDKQSYDRHRRTYPCYRPFICEMCGISCSCKDSLRDHVMRNHIGNEQNSVIKSRFPCHVCGLSFKYKSDLETHTRMLTCRKSFSCDCCGTKFRLKKSLIGHMKIHPGMSTHQCQICEKSYTSLRILKRHVSSHLDLRPFSHDVCDEYSTHDTTVNRYVDTSKKEGHVLPSHSPCPICGSRFSFKRSLVNHLLKCMYRRKPIPCNICRKSYPTHRQLRNHMQSHSREKSHPCGTFGKVLPSRNCMSLPHADDQPYSCEICVKKFKSKANVLIHTLRFHPWGHRPFYCDVCSKSFTLKCDLRKHLMKHMCNFCGKIYKRTGDLFQHKKLHTGNKLFLCNICDEGFVFRGHLLQHSLTHAVKTRTRKNRM